MPAPSTESLYDFSGLFSVATGKVLATGGYNQSFLERQSTRLKTSLRYEISFSLGEALNQHTLDNGQKVYDFYAAALRIRLVTGRRTQLAAPGQEVRELHDKFVAKALALLEERRDPFGALLDWYEVRMIRPLGTTPGFDSVYLEDFTDVAFALQFGIKADAFPAAVA